MHLLWNTLAKLVPWKCVLCGCPILVKSITSGAYLHLSVTVTKSKVLPLPAGSSLGGGGRYRGRRRSLLPATKHRACRNNIMVLFYPKKACGLIEEKNVLWMSVNTQLTKHGQ